MSMDWPKWLMDSCCSPCAEYLDFFTPCSPGWPPLVRICPILSWDYHQVWKYIHDSSLQYCCLYDEGYACSAE